MRILRHTSHSAFGAILGPKQKKKRYLSFHRLIIFEAMNTMTVHANDLPLSMRADKQHRVSFDPITLASLAIERGPRTPNPTMYYTRPKTTMQTPPLHHHCDQSSTKRLLSLEETTLWETTRKNEMYPYPTPLPGLTICLSTCLYCNTNVKMLRNRTNHEHKR